MSASDTPPPPAHDRHHQHFRLALELAARALCTSNPNPRVGCVITRADGRVIGQGHTQPRGGPHAEVMALRDAARHGRDCTGGVAYVTLEPCSHHGRTPPCCDALIAAGIAHVHVALPDPNPLVAGQGLARLRAAGIAVHTAPADIARAAWQLNLGFFSRMQRQRPWVRLKTATSLDGRTALPNGHSQWITSAAARADVQHWRARACAIATGVGTVLADDPLLNARLDGQPRQPLLVILDSQLRTPTTARLWSVPQRPVWIATTAPTGHPAPEQAAWHTRQQALIAQGAQILVLPPAAPYTDPIQPFHPDTSGNRPIPPQNGAEQAGQTGMPFRTQKSPPIQPSCPVEGGHRTIPLHTKSGQTAPPGPGSMPDMAPHTPPSHAQPSLPHLLHALAMQAEVNELHIEAGPTLAAAWLHAGLVDELLSYIAPRLLGPGLPLAHLPPLHRVDDAPRWTPVACDITGDDVRLQLYGDTYGLHPQVSWPLGLDTP